MAENLSELIQAARSPLVIVAGTLFVFSLAVLMWAKITARTGQISRTAAVSAALGVVIAAMAAYQSMRQSESDKEYRNLHAVYDVQALIKGTVRTRLLSEPLIFRASSGQVNVGCNDSQRTNAVWSRPEGATEVQATATWENTNNIKSQSQTVTNTAEAVAASGLLLGLDRTWLGNCPGGGHGELVLSGTYRIATDRVDAPQTLKTVQDKVNRDQSFIVVVPQDKNITPNACEIIVQKGSRKEVIEVSFRRDAAGNLSIGETRQTGSIPTSVILDNDRIIFKVL